ncbi:MAG: maleylpyruvate isomerase N-terminal domain-containing protein [Acidobacteria bacterium]|nr:maleylpyruvate isomerase N-terminal domain-containing protein [Acidobacteriota bacterium]MCL5286605.1 maleylpyruvate isomerase N-terminal domain-containing protein [Acidobacteriota bacterium]
MDKTVEGLQPIFTAALFPKLEAKLLELLRSLAPADWERQTLAPQWKVKDVAAHLLDTQLRKLSIARDGVAPEPAAIHSHADLVALINRLNQEGVNVYRRLSPQVLIALMEMASKQSCEFHASLDPHAPAHFAVSWAGEEKSANWFDTAREFTERWHHQQQIRLAVDKPGIMTREFYYPVLDCFMRALPFTYRTVYSRPGTLAQFNISGECGGSWFLFCDDGSWKLVVSEVGEKISDTTIPQEIAWRIFTKGIDRQSAEAVVRVNGHTAIGLHILEMLSIVG